MVIFVSRGILNSSVHIVGKHVLSVTVDRTSYMKRFMKDFDIEREN